MPHDTESEHLDVHVAVCAERYRSLEMRLDRIERVMCREALLAIERAFIDRLSKIAPQQAMTAVEPVAERARTPLLSPGGSLRDHVAHRALSEGEIDNLGECTLHIVWIDIALLDHPVERHTDDLERARKLIVSLLFHTFRFGLGERLLARVLPVDRDPPVAEHDPHVPCEDACDRRERVGLALGSLGGERAACRQIEVTVSQPIADGGARREQL